MPEIINGTAGDDTVDYTNPQSRTPEIAETINGLAGDDTIYGFRGNDILTGDAGNDILYGQEDDDTLNGGDGNDVLLGDVGNDTIDGGAGDDVIDGGAGDDIVNGGIGNDTIQITLGDDRLYGNDGDDIFRSAPRSTRDNLSKSLVLDGGAGIDTLFAGNIDNIIGVKDIEILDMTGAFSVYLSVDVINSFTAFRGSVYSGIVGDIRINLTDGGAVDFTNKTSSGVVIQSSSEGSVVTGTSFDDYFAGNAGDDSFFGGLGNDKFTSFFGNGREADGKKYYDGGDGDDDFYVSAGINTLHGGSGSDKFTIGAFGDYYYPETSINYNYFYGESGDDLFVLKTGVGLADGGEGIDTADLNPEDGYDRDVTPSSFELRNIEVIKGVGFAYVAAREIANLTQVDKTVSFYIATSGEVDFARFIDGLGVLNASSEGNTIIGTRVADKIVGGSAADNLIGGFGDDVLKGQGGDDTLEGGDGSDVLVGGDGHDTLRGSDGNDELNGGLGIDRLEGGAGDDTYRVDSEDDIVVEVAGQGNDKILTTVSYVLARGQEIETIQLAQPSHSNPFALTGNEFAQTLIGNGGDNTLAGRGGADIMQGLAGNDTYGVDDADDRVIESAGGGNDQVITNVSYTLTAGQEIETLRFASAFRGKANLTGNEFANTLRGNGADNVLNGKGGADILIGGGGNDAYTVDHASDRVVEATGEGRDTVVTTVSYRLSAGQQIEILQTEDASGTASLNLTGNEFANTLIGNAGDNVLDGGAGIDVMRGGAGNDIYRVDRAEDRVFEAAGQGRDTVVATVTYALRAGQEIETLQFARSTGTTVLKFTGNEFANTLLGNASANILDGGLGGDVLTGGRGADTFVFSTALGSGNVDRITDFTGADTIRLSKSLFSTLARGELKAKEFKDIAGAKVDADDHILYDSRNGALFYDADGSGKVAAVKFAVLDNKAAITHADFLIV